VVEEAKKLLKGLMIKYKPHLKEVGEKLAVALGDKQASKRCLLCHREVVKDGLCAIHAAAEQAIYEGYKEWRKRLGVSFEEYLSKLARMRGAGMAVRDVAQNYASLRKLRSNL
jgi:hypothetical protein